MNRILTLFSVFLVVCLITACDNDNDTQEIIQVLTENDFANDETIRADFEQHNLVKFLEPPGLDEPGNDTGELGSDIIPVTYSRTVEHTFCWEDEDDDAGHFMELSDSEGSIILSLDTNGECITEIIEAGDYIVTLFHDGLSDDIRPIFLIPNSSDFNDEQQATNQLTHYYGLVKEIALNYLQNSITNEVKAQTVQDNINTLIKTGNCDSCNLIGADLRMVHLRNAELRGALLTGADLRNAELEMAGLVGADLIFARMEGADLFDADLSGATLRDVNLSGAELGTAELQMANLTGAILRDANLSSATLYGATLNDADLTGADLTDATLHFAQLNGANLSDATLYGVELGRAELRMANLTGADLSTARLDMVDLTGADLTGADLTGADLTGAILSDATLTNADLSGAILRDANLFRAKLNDADLTGADLSFASLRDANLRDATLFRAKLNDADLTDADLSMAKWCDGICICGSNSIGICDGCQSVEEVCTIK